MLSSHSSTLEPPPAGDEPARLRPIEGGLRDPLAACCRAHRYCPAGDVVVSEPTTPAAPTSTAAAPTRTPTPTPTSTPTPEPEYTIGDTGGVGVALRSDCSSEARSGGAWADGTVVTIVRIGTDACDGWAEVETASVVSWVREQYLSEVEARDVSAPAQVSTPRSACPTAAQARYFAALSADL